MKRTFAKRFETSNRISAYLRVCKLVTGRYGIETKGLHRNDFIYNVNHPLFSTREDAENYLQENYEEVMA